MTGNGVFLRHDDFKWWLFLDTVVAEMLGGSRYSRLQGDLQEMVRQWSRATLAASQSGR